jgi:hypothetical protein
MMGRGGIQQTKKETKMTTKIIQNSLATKVLIFFLYTTPLVPNCKPFGLF